MKSAKRKTKAQNHPPSVIPTPIFMRVNCSGNPGMKDKKRKIDSRFRGNDIEDAGMT